MPVFSGNTSGSISQVAANIPSGILTYSVVNKSGGNATVNIYISDGLGTDISIVPLNLLLSAGDTLYSSNGIRVLKDTSIYITTTGSIDYYFSID